MKRSAAPELAASSFPFRELRKVGEGATAEVFRARSTTPAGDLEVALKVARAPGPAADDADARELEVLASLDRRWGPTLVGAGRAPAGTPLREGARWIATTWAEGRGLDTVVSEAGSASARDALARVVAHGAAHGLAELHALGLVHGDVKLANIIVGDRVPASDRAAERGATLIDVGLARVVAGDRATGGTPRYLAPELRRGDPHTPAADLFALGLVLAEIRDPTLVAHDDPASAHSARTARAAPGELDAWIGALLSPTPGARPAAAWIASRAAQALGLARDDDELRAARQARVRRAYLAVRRSELRAGVTLDAAITGAPRDWLEQALVAASLLAAPPADLPPALRPLDALGRSRWLAALVGPAAAAWRALDALDDAALAARLEALAATSAPESWTFDDLRDPRVPSSLPVLPVLGVEPAERWLALTRGLLAPQPDEALLEAAESAVTTGDAPASVVLDLGAALLRRGAVGRAFVAVTAAGASSSRPSPELALLRAEIARRRGDVEGARARATELLEAAGVARATRDDAAALVARLAWDRGALDEAEAVLAGAAGAAAAESRALVAYARGEPEQGLAAVADAAREATSALGTARLEGTRGMLEHARGDAAASLRAFMLAADLAARAGAVVEEATYLTGLAAAAADAGATGPSLAASTRAAVLWERLDRPAFAARALLGRAAAYALVGASHLADDAARLAIARARDIGDGRAEAYAHWALVETRTPGDPLAVASVLAADALLANGSDDDRVRSAARLLVWGAGRPIAPEVAAAARRVATLSPAARWEWWGARATALLATRGASLAAAGALPLAELVALLDVPAPIGSRGPALAAGARLAAELGDSDRARRLETARRIAAEALREGCPPEHRASLAAVPWAFAQAEGPTMTPLGSAQVEQLDAIVRSLASRDRLKPLLEQVLDTMVLWTGVERGLLLLRAPSGNLVPRVARNLARHDLHGEQLTLSMTLARRAMEERQAVCATDAYAQVGDLHASVHALRLRSVLAVPLVARGDVLGVVYLDDRVRRGAFGDAELGWVRLVASQAALAIADARDQVLLRRAVRRAERANARLATELGAREAELASVRAELAEGQGTRFRYDAIAGRSEPMQQMLRVVDRVTASDVPVLIVGESGTGKELVARAIHDNGARGKQSFVSENCGSVPETLLESTLFGHVRGAFTGASATRTGLFDVADGGTLFLDEIGEMPLSMQTKLLRVLQNGEVRPVGSERTHRVDVRIIGATNRDLEAMVAAGTFREDLFYRLNVVSVRVPALRERTSDIPLLVSHFTQKHGGPRKPKVTRAALERLVAFPWPGNVRQLENEIRRAFVLADDRIDVPELSDEVARGGPLAARTAGVGLKDRVDALEAQLVKEALERSKGNQTRAAEALGISRFGLQKMMKRLGIRVTLS